MRRVDGWEASTVFHLLWVNGTALRTLRINSNAVLDGRNQVTFSAIIDKIKYRKERVGLAEKDGKTYMKYIKVRRFKISTRMKYAVWSVFILVILGVCIKILMSEMAAAVPAEGQ